MRNSSMVSSALAALVKLEDLTFKEEVTYHIVGSTEADILNNKISNEAPIGKALLGAEDRRCGRSGRRRPGESI